MPKFADRKVLLLNGVQLLIVLKRVSKNLALDRVCAKFGVEDSTIVGAPQDTIETDNVPIEAGGD